MKIHLLISEGVTQIMMTPETEHERKALKFIAPGDSLHTVKVNTGSFHSPDDENESLMFVVKSKDKEE